jgi:DNA invertase Pin-like site-specific DNA recombinase
MPQGRRHKPEEIVALLRRIEMSVAKGCPVAQTCRAAGITEQTYYRWRGEYGALDANQAKRLRRLVDENIRLKRILSEYGLHVGAQAET